jgi:excisionase family DNA binding protein
MEIEMASQTPQENQSVAEGRASGQLLAPKWDGRDTFTVEEAAEILRISRGSAYAAAKNGALPVVGINRVLRVPRRALERMLG